MIVSATNVLAQHYNDRLANDPKQTCIVNNSRKCDQTSWSFTKELICSHKVRNQSTRSLQTCSNIKELRTDNLIVLIFKFCSNMLKQENSIILKNNNDQNVEYYKFSNDIVLKF